MSTNTVVLLLCLMLCGCISYMTHENNSHNIVSTNFGSSDVEVARTASAPTGIIDYVTVRPGDGVVSKVQQLTIGMSYESIVCILGEPAFDCSFGNIYAWWRLDMHHWFIPDCEGDRVVKLRFYEGEPGHADFREMDVNRMDYVRLHNCVFVDFLRSP